eukprot:TRINITY_DN5776_c0_g1_i1.p2 TRINITY_DN5776_c0_g1~~TRINITY_DN5776_c0_g1_i1.p2  ORF type:complete len:205 (-),score=57.18 TRINITY_DN5776_c0_g1_i1:185-799(-)
MSSKQGSFYFGSRRAESALEESDEFATAVLDTSLLEACEELRITPLWRDVLQELASRGAHLEFAADSVTVTCPAESEALRSACAEEFARASPVWQLTTAEAPSETELYVIALEAQTMSEAVSVFLRQTLAWCGNFELELALSDLRAEDGVDLSWSEWVSQCTTEHTFRASGRVSSSVQVLCTGNDVLRVGGGGGIFRAVKYLTS